MIDESKGSTGLIGRRQFVQFCAGSLALAAAGCGRGRHRGPAGSSRITVLFPADLEGTLYTESPSQFLVFLPLVARNANGELEGRLAESWEHSPDYRSWTVHLRKNARWHDGVPVTARDIKFTLDLLSHPQVHYWPPGAYAVTVLDESTYRIKVEKDRVGTPLDDWTVIYPKHLLENLNPSTFWEWEFWNHPIGDGPYRYVRHVPKIMAEFEANPDYYRGEPKIRQVILKFGETSGTLALTELLSGNVDVVPYANPMSVLKLARDQRFQVYDAMYPEHIRMIAWNNRNPLFRDPQVRRALTLAINRDELRQVLSLPESTPTFDVLLTPDQLRRGEVPRPLPYDPSQSEHLLDQMGCRDVNGWRACHGQRLRFTALVWNEYGLNEAAIAVQAQLRRVGIQMEVATLDEQALLQRVRRGDFDAVIMTMFDRGPFGHLAWFAAPSYVGYSNPTVTSLLQRVQAAANPNEIDHLYRELWPIFAADLPVTFLFPSVVPTVANRRIKGLSSPFHADPVWYMEGLWLEDRGVR